MRDYKVLAYCEYGKNNRVWNKIMAGDYEGALMILEQEWPRKSGDPETLSSAQVGGATLKEVRGKILAWAHPFTSEEGFMAVLEK